MTKEIRVRQAKEEDLARIGEIVYETWLATYPNTSLGITKEWIEKLFERKNTPENLQRRLDDIKNQSDTFKILVAQEGEDIVGVGRFLQNDDRNILKMLYVLPEYQGHGIGTRLWEEGKKIFDPNKKTFVSVADYNNKAITFYKKLGFCENGKNFVDERFSQGGIGILEIEMEI